MNKTASSLNILILTIATFFMVVLFLPLAASAATITNGSLLLGDPRPSQVSTYTFSGAGFSGGNIGCIELVFDTQADGGGSVPAGMDTTSTTYDSSTLVGGGWTVANPGNGTVRITNSTPAAPNASGNVVWGGITNSDTEGTYYGTFTTYTDSGCSGGNEVDTTVVGFVITDGTLVQLTIDPTLTFSVNGITSGTTLYGATDTTVNHRCA
jgi:hypothetical protein